MSENVFDKGSPERIDTWLSQLTGRSRSFIKTCCEHGKILVNKKAVRPSHLVKPGDAVSYELTEEPLELEATNIPLDILFEDNDIIVINKPVGLTVHPGAGNKAETLVNALLFHHKTLSSGSEAFRPGIVHRLDKDTSGVMVIAKNNQAHEKLADQFKHRTIEKTYIALIHGLLDEKTGSITLPISRHPNIYHKFTVNSKGKTARTDYEVLRESNEKSLIKIQLHTGRTHQIRVHFSALGHPLVGDPLYGKNDGKRQLLHAYELAFTHPHTGKALHFKAPLPKWAKI